LSTSADAQSFKLPPNYFNRFSNTDVTVSNESGFGIRYFPLPTTTDIRLSLVKNPEYWEYNFSIYGKDTTFSAGVYGGDIPSLAFVYAPAQGPQFSGAVQHFSGVLPYTAHHPFSYFSGGYANLILNGQARVINNIGLGFKTYTALNEKGDGYKVTGEAAKLFTESIIGGGTGKKLTDAVDVRFSGSARLYTFPMDQIWQASVDLMPGINIHPLPGLQIDVRHFARYAIGNGPAGSVPLPNLSFCSYLIAGSGACQFQLSNAALSYRFQDTSSAIGLGMFRVRLERDWLADYTFWRNDVLLSTSALPVLIGPSIGYQFGPNSSTRRWLFSLSTAPK